MDDAKLRSDVRGDFAEVGNDGSPGYLWLIIVVDTGDLNADSVDVRPSILVFSISLFVLLTFPQNLNKVFL